MELKAAVESIRTSFQGELLINAPLSKVAYYRIGGKAQVLATPRSFDDLQRIHGMIQETGVPYFIFGWGSNLLFSDDGFRGVVIRMKHLFTECEELDSSTLKLGASLGTSLLLKSASENGYGGFERLTGIPGSVGGMVAMNAGTHLGEIKDLLIKTEYVSFNDPQLKVKTRVHEASDFSYRHNHFLKPDDVVTHTYAKFTRAVPATVKKTIDELYARRKATQPVDYPSCGSVFMNPREAGLHAWQVVDKLGLRGHRIGNAQISEKHSNFIVNLGGATARDVSALIDLVKSRAQSELGIQMKEEVKLVGAT